MKSMVVFSSKTGNTKKVARVIFEALPDPKNIFTVEENPSIEQYDLIVLGYWVDKGTADTKARNFFEKVKDKKIAIFGTLGAYPDSEHADSCRANVRALLKENTILGDFICQGKVDPKLIEMMAAMAKGDPNHFHAMNPERKERLKEAEKHPNEQDFDKAGGFILQMVKKYEEIQ